MMVFRALIASFALGVFATVAAACPDPNLYGDTYELSGADLYNPQSV